MKILYLCQRLPFPPNRGDRIVTYSQIRHLRRSHEVLIGSLNHGGDPGQREPDTPFPREHLIAPRHSWKHKIAGMAASMAGRRPLTPGYFRNPGLRLELDSILRTGSVDAVIVFSSSMAQYVDHHPRVPRIMHFCDVDSQKWSDLAKRSSGPMRYVYAREARLLLQYERRIAAQYSASCVVTRHEADLFRKCIPGRPVHILENGVDLDYFAAMPPAPSGIRLVFVGVMDYPPNREAVEHFAKEVWPGVRSSCPEARFIVVGSRPAPSILRLAKQPGIEITGHVAGIRPYLASATLLVAPLEIARGVQNKILEAMAAGLPVLTTPVVAAGLSPEAQRCIFTEERKPIAFGKAILQLLGQPHLMAEKSAAALQYVRRCCTWDAKLADLDRLLDQVAAPALRQSRAS